MLTLQSNFGTLTCWIGPCCRRTGNAAGCSHYCLPFQCVLVHAELVFNSAFVMLQFTLNWSSIQPVLRSETGWIAQSYRLDKQMVLPTSSQQQGKSFQNICSICSTSRTYWELDRCRNSRWGADVDICSPSAPM